ncbi:MAG: YihY/virulence factor BrkB family protein [Myxococcota bacterium]
MSVASWIQRGRSFVTEGLWSDEEPYSQLFVVRVLQFGIMVVEGFVRDHLLLRASGLAYFTVLSVVPLIAVAVSIASAVGVGGEDFVEWVVGTVAATSPEAQATIRQLVAGTSFGGLGTLSAVVLFLTTVLAISNVETAFNSIWGVAHSRSLGRRFSDYLAVLVAGPLLGGAALSLTTSMQSQWVLQRLLEVPLFSTLYAFGLSQLPVVMLALVFAFLYWFLPNTRVHAFSALLGGVTASLLTLLAQGLYVDFSVGVTRASIFFGPVASLAVLFVWIYAFWAIVLFGAEIAFAHQNLHLYRRQVRGKPAGPAEREAMGLRIALEVGRRFRDRAPAVDAGTLSDALHAPVRTVREVVDRLCDAGILAHRASETSRETLTLGQPAEGIAVTALLGALRGDREVAGGNAQVAGVVDAILGELEQSVVTTAAGRTLADLLEALPPLPADAPAADVDREEAPE